MSLLTFHNGWTDRNVDCCVNTNNENVTTAKNIMNFGQGTLLWQPILWRETATSWHTPPLLFVLATDDCCEAWPHHGRTFSNYLCPLSLWLTLSWGVLSRYWCCPPRPRMVVIACVHLALFLALSLSPGNSLVSSWCDHNTLTFLLWQYLTVPPLLQLC